MKKKHLKRIVCQQAQQIDALKAALDARRSGDRITTLERRVADLELGGVVRSAPVYTSPACSFPSNLRPSEWPSVDSWGTVLTADDDALNPNIWGGIFDGGFR